MLPEYKAYDAWAHYVQPPSSLHTRTHILLLPPHTLPMHPRLIAELGDVARELRADVVFGPQGVMLVHWQRYYAAVGRHLATLRAEGFTFSTLRAVLLDAGLIIKDVPVQAMTRDPLCTRVVLELGQADVEPCMCTQLEVLVVQPLWKAAVAKLMPEDRVIEWIDELLVRCRQQLSSE